MINNALLSYRYDSTSLETGTQSCTIHLVVDSQPPAAVEATQGDFGKL
jgi:hypothetical protein